MRIDSVTVGRAPPIFTAVVLDIAASLFMFAALAPASARPVIDITPLVIEPETEPAPKVKAPVKPKVARKKKPKQITYQPALTDKLDGRRTAGMKLRSANENADFVPSNVGAFDE